MPRITKVTTRRGDDGYTDLASGRRVRKDSKVVQALGSLDELNSTIGFIRSQNPLPEISDRLQEIQNDLFCAGAMLAGLALGKQGPRLDPGRITTMEREIAALQERLGPLENFILPGGDSCASATHLARAVCRRAERCVVALSRAVPAAGAVRVYLNRLSDLLFQYARMENRSAGREELYWNSR